MKFKVGDKVKLIFDGDMVLTVSKVDEVHDIYALIDSTETLYGVYWGCNIESGEIK